jgi:hypothetical protein
MKRRINQRRRVSNREKRDKRRIWGWMKAFVCTAFSPNSVIRDRKLIRCVGRFQDRE